MTRLWIVGGGGAALEVWAVHRALEALAGAVSGQIPLYGFVNLEPEVEFDPEGLVCRKETEFLEDADPTLDRVVLALGAPGPRSQIAAKFRGKGFNFESLVHPSAILGPNVKLGEGSVVMAGAVLETHVQVGPHCLINVLSSLAHEVVLGSCCSVGPGVRIAGKAQVGSRCDLGVGAVVRPGVRLGNDVVVGAGAAVVSDWEGPTTLVGVPARPMV